MHSLFSYFHKQWPADSTSNSTGRLPRRRRSPSGFLLLTAKPFWVELIYFLSLSSLGYLLLKATRFRTEHSFTPANLDIFFTAVSAATVSSMSTVEMEVFSNPQLLIMTLLMFVGGEVFTSMVGLFLRYYKIKKLQRDEGRTAAFPAAGDEIFRGKDINFRNSVKFLALLVLCYLLVVNLIGTVLVYHYVSAVPSARTILRTRSIKLVTFSAFTTISTFTNCGFVPTNENMIVFSKNSLLLMILIPQILLGNTLFPSCLRLFIWMAGKIKKYNSVYEYSELLLNKTEEFKYSHLLPARHSKYLVGTVVGFIAVQVAVFCATEWDSESLRGLTVLQKLIGVLFQCVNTRHAGESIVDLSVIAPAVQVIFVIIMYLPPYTSFLPVVSGEDYQLEGEIWKRKVIRGKIMVENLVFSQLSYIAVFVILICITERRSLKDDPLNFNVLNITFEVVSAYGNVGFSTGYSCKRRLSADANCKDKWFSFAGKWTDGGKIILITVMVFGRLKKFNVTGGRAWKLL